MSTMPNISRRELFILLSLIIVIFILDVYPNVVLDSLYLGISSLLINISQKIFLSFCPVLIKFLSSNIKFIFNLKINFIMFPKERRKIKNSHYILDKSNILGKVLNKAGYDRIFIKIIINFVTILW